VNRAFIDGVETAAYTIPTDASEADGTPEWNETTIVVVEATAGTARDIGYSYTRSAAAQIIRDDLWCAGAM
jgi:hypothetical protein